MGAKPRKKLTTFQIANMLGVSDQSVSNWVDAGQLPAERTPGGHRRVEPADLIEFLKVQGMRIPPELNPAPPTALVVDDEVNVAEWIAQSLRGAFPGLRVLTASDGFDAGKMVTAETPDVVILDLYMPGMDGFEVCRRIKRDPKTKTVKVIAMTAHHSEDAQAAAVQAGADGYLPKPLSIQELSSLLTDLVGRESLRA